MYVDCGEQGDVGCAGPHCDPAEAVDRRLRVVLRAQVCHTTEVLPHCVEAAVG